MKFHPIPPSMLPMTMHLKNLKEKKAINIYSRYEERKSPNCLSCPKIMDYNINLSNSDSTSL